MIKSFDFYFDFVSPYSFLAHKELRKIENKESIKIKYMPVLLGGLHNLHGIKAPAFIPAKAKHMIRDCKLIAEKNNVKFKFNSYFPIRSLNLMRGVLVAEEDNIKELVKELNLTTQVMFFKDISDDLKNALVASSNIFVMPSIIHKTSVEGFGIAYVEAAQYGVASLGGKDGGASDAIQHDKTGLICDGNSLEDIYSSLNSMIENKKYLEFGKNAKELSSQFYWSNIVERYKKILTAN